MTTRNGLAAEHAARETVTAALDRAVAAHLAEGGCAGQLGVMTGQALARPGAAAPPVPVAVPPRTGPVMRCPRCGAVLDGGPVWFRCQPCRRAVVAADVDTEFHVPGSRAAA